MPGTGSENNFLFMRVLIYAGSNTAKELEFWRRLSDALALRDAEVFFILPSGVPTDALPNVVPDIRNFGRLELLRMKRCGLSRAALSGINDLIRAWKTDHYRDFDTVRETHGYRSLIQRLSPDLIVTWGVYRPPSAILHQLAISLGYGRAVLERSPWPLALTLDHDDTLANTAVCESLKAAAQANEFDPEDAERGRSFFNALNERSHTWWEQPDRRAEEDLRESLGIPIGTEICLFAGQVDGDAQNFIFSTHTQTNLDALRQFLETLPADSNIFVLGKHHPKSDTRVEDYQEVLGERGVWSDSVSLLDCFRIADRVAGVNSALLFEAAAHGLPVLSMGRTMVEGCGVFFEWSKSVDSDATCAFFAAEAQEVALRSERFRSLTGRALRTGCYILPGGFAHPGLLYFEAAADKLLQWAVPRPNEKTGGLKELWESYERLNRWFKIPKACYRFFKPAQ